jgi:hypothetical protein
MRSHAETAAHVGAILLLAWALVDALDAGSTGRDAVTGVAEPSVLARWSTGLAPARAHVRIPELPTPAVRDWLAALARSGTTVTWNGDSLVPLAATVEPTADPRGGHRVRVAAPRGAGVMLADDAGEVGTLRVASVGATIGARTLAGSVSATAGGRGARAALERGATVRDVLVLGGAGWEAKFVITALEEAGWTVTARLAVAPETWIEQRTLGAIDTARFSAVVVLDTSAGRWSREVARYARSGGGVVLAGNAASLASLAAIAPGRAAEYLPAAPGSPPDSAPRLALGVHPITRLTDDALVLERRDDVVTAAARRLALGKVMQLAYDETWRWRLAGGDEAPRQHREWWSRVVSSVAYARPAVWASPADSLVIAAHATDSLDAAPYAHLVDVLGIPSATPASRSAQQASLPAWVLYLATALFLLAWGSRRLRGAP